MVISNKHLQRISQFFKKLIKQVQSLPTNTAEPAPYLLLGLLPLEAYYDKNLVSLYACVLRDRLVRQVAARQLSIKDFRSHSWFIHVEKRLSRYQLTSPAECLVQDINPDYWARSAKQIISRHWLEDLYTKTEAYGSLKYIEPRLELPQRPLQVWRTGRNDALSTKQVIVKARLLTGTYRLQGNRSVFNQHANCAGRETKTGCTLWSSVEPCMLLELHIWRSYCVIWVLASLMTSCYSASYSIRAATSTDYLQRIRMLICSIWRH